MAKTVLFVDDDRPILRTLQRSLKNGGFAILLAESGAEALEILRRQHVDLIVSDVRMPVMDGHQLLKEVQRLYPSVIRLLLSGQADDGELASALADGSCKLYIQKPWDSKALIEIIRQQLEITN